ncbi:MAG: hypothetical protein IPH44_02135 [Myxococcales bacterium]|nr:hypothetical protein [Myxococcales bacterium]MBK7198117.1 hypothetical protein [Myxococcales bacterium]MBP6847772.1 hypothetical protein [Kofleriaceae bacterium]
MRPRARAVAVVALIVGAQALPLVPGLDVRLALVAGTLGVAGGLHGLGRVVGRALARDDAPVALAISWGLALVAPLGALVQRGAPTALIDIALGLGAALGGAWAASPTPLGARGWPRAPVAIACAFAGLAILAGAGDHHGLGSAAHHPRGLQAGLDLLTHRVAASAHLLDDGWGFALVLGLIFTRLDAGHAIGRVTLVLVLAALPFDGHDLAPRWTLIALILAAHVTARTVPGRRAQLVALALTAAAIALAVPPTRPAHAGIAVGLAAIVIALTTVLADDRADAVVDTGRARGTTALVAVCLIIMLVLVGVRTRRGVPATSWQDRLRYRIDVAVSLGDLPRAR